MGVAWPTREWQSAPCKSRRLEALLDLMFEDATVYGETYAALVVRGSEIVAERYSGALPNFVGPAIPVDIDTPLLSWSMAKSITHAAVGILKGRGSLDVTDRLSVPEWQQDERRNIRIDDLLAMRDGLDFVEDYIDGEASDVIEMLFGAGADDVARYAKAKPVAHAPDEVFNYSSGSTNIVARLVGDIVGGGEPGMRRFLTTELFGPIGMTSADPRFDATGTFIGSSYVHATARDFARFGLLYLRDGMWDGRRLLPEGWVDHGRTLRSIDPENCRGYGAQWWVVGDEFGSFWASGYEGQMTVCVPSLDLLIVRLGKTDASLGPNLYEWRARVTQACAED